MSAPSAIDSHSAAWTEPARQPLGAWLIRHRGSGAVSVVVLAIALVAPQVTTGTMAYVLLTTAFWSATAIGWYFFGGLSRYYLLGSGVFIGVAAYATALGNNQHYLPLQYVPVGVAAALLVACLMYPLLRLTELFFALATLVTPLTIGGIANYFQLVEIPINAPAALVDPNLVYYGLLAVTVVLLVVAVWVTRSALGIRLRAISESTLAAAAAGVDPVRTRFYALLMTACSLGVSGSVYPVVVQVVSSRDAFGTDVTLRPFVISIVGGLGSPIGAILGSVILVPLSDFLNSSLSSFRSGVNLLLYGILLVMIAVAFPDGAYGLILRGLGLVPRGRPSASSAAAADVVRDPGFPGASGGAFDAQTRALLSGVNGTGKELVLYDLSAQYGGVAAVSNVSLTIRPGEIVGVIGPNGAGKTTLVNVISGATQGLTLSGRLTFGGRSLAGIPLHTRARLGMWRSFQHPTALTRLTSAESVALGLMNRRIPRRAAIAAAEHLFVAIEKRWGLSAGFTTPFGIKLVEVLRVLCSGAPLVLLDEPLAGLSEYESNAMVDLIREASSHDRAIVIVDHSVPFLKAVSHRLVAFNLGRVIGDGLPNEVVALATVVESYIGAAE